MKNLSTKYLLLFVLLFSILTNAEGQISNGMPFTFSATTPSVAAVSPTLINMIGRPAVLRDEFDTLITPAPAGSWSFPFAGAIYTRFVLSSNGWLALVPASYAATTVPPSIPNALPINQLNNNTTGYPIIAPLWDDDSCSIYQYGVAANVLTVKWTVKWDKSAAGAYAALMWVTLDGNTGIIEFHYSTTAYVQGAGATASIGIAGVCTGDFYSVTPNAIVASSTVDVVTENSTVTLKPVSGRFAFTPSCPNDNCAGAKFMGNVAAACAPVLTNTFLATATGPGNCSTTDVKDVWYSYLKAAGQSSVKFTTSPNPGCGAVTGTSVEVYDACGGTMIGCSATSTGPNPTYGEVTVSRSACIAETLYVRVTGDGDLPGKFQICAMSIASTLGVNCTSPAPVCAPLPFNATGLTTQGFTNDYGDSSLCQSDWMLGQDYVFNYTPAVTQCVNIIIDGTGAASYPGLFLFDGCPNDTDFSSCVASAQNAGFGDSIMNVTLSAGHNYFIVVDNNPLLAALNYMPFGIHITSSVSPAPPNDACSGAANLGTILFNAGCTWSATFSTQCANPSPMPPGYPNPVCGQFMPATTNDVWFTFTPNFSGTLLINSQGVGLNPVAHGGFAVYTGSCGLFTLVGCAGDSVGIPFMPSLSLAVTNQQYYLRFWSATYLDPGTFQLCFQSNCAPPNDLPVNSVTLPLATPMLGDNTCSTGSSEMPNPINCPTGTVNTVWYKVTVPASGNLAVRISQLSLLDAALAAFYFPTGPANAVSSFTRLACNDDIIFAPPCPICGMTGDNDAAIQMTGLTPGALVYIAVDGESGQVGSFYITAIDGSLSSTFPPVYRKDCANPEFLCDNGNYLRPNGGIGSDGKICDFTNLACSPGATVSELGSTWLQFTVAPGSTLGFTITPNDSASPVANYNFFLWDVTGVSNFCNQLSTLPPVRCNTVAGTGKTGCRAPAAGVWSNTVPSPSPVVPHTYMLFVQNLTSGSDDEGVPGTNTGFVLDWTIYTGAVPSGITSLVGSSPTCNWTGTVINTDYQYLPNWKGVGNCPAVLPSCTTDVNISAASQICAVTGNSYAKNLTINAGGTLQLAPGANMHICGNYINNGTLTAQPGSTITFEGPGRQTITGNLTGANAFPSLVINKANLTDTVVLMNNIDVNENFLTSSATSPFSINKKYMKVGGNFTNAKGKSTFSMISGSTVEFNGVFHQNLNNILDSMIFNRVIMNKNVGNLYMIAPNSSMYIDSVLTLTKGNIVTTSTMEVFARCPSPGAATAVTAYSPNSFIRGRLRRKLFFPGSIDWPVGDDSLVVNQGANKGYELANITFTTSTVIPELMAWFSVWPAGVVPNGPATFDFCDSVPAPILGPNSYTTQYNQQIFDHGYWNFQRFVPNFNGKYNIKLYNTGGTNTGGGVAWSIATAALAANPMLPASWSLLGKCNYTSTAAVSKRDTINNPNGVPATSATSFNHLYSTVQTSIVLPVELLFFTAEPVGEEVICKWETASEINNDYFDVERSTNGKDFIAIGRVKGFGLGNSSELRNYSFVDHDFCSDIRYYRLKQVDIDGQYNYKEPVAVRCSQNRNDIQVYPNPAKTSMFSTFYETKGGSIKLQWLDVLGKIVKEENHDVVKGYNTIQSDIAELVQGIYYLRIRDSGNDSSEEDRRIKFFKD